MLDQLEACFREQRTSLVMASSGQYFRHTLPVGLHGAFRDALQQANRSLEVLAEHGRQQHKHALLSRLSHLNSESVIRNLQTNQEDLKHVATRSRTRGRWPIARCWRTSAAAPGCNPEFEGMDIGVVPLFGEKQLKGTQDLIGQDYWSEGVEAERPTFEIFLRRHHAQELMARQKEVEAPFHSGWVYLGGSDRQACSVHAADSFFVRTPE